MVAACDILRRPDSAVGFLYALSLTKPNVTGTFALHWLRPRGIRALFVAGGVLVAATCAVALYTHVSPIEMTRQWWLSARLNEGGGYGLLNVLLALGAPGHIATPLLAATVLLVLGIAYRSMPGASAVDRLALASVAARIWSYHQVYDNGVLVFLLVACGLRALRNRRRESWIVFLAVGSTLWTPPRFAVLAPAQVVEHLVWLAGATYVFVGARRACPEEESPPTLRIA